MKLVEAVVVSHTHWDREWYLPFEQFRARLVALVDYVVDLLERKDSFRCFTLDGQAVVLEDYLEIRPENEERLRRLIRERRLLVGPWYVLPDEFLSTEEAIVRNLLVGGSVARRFGAVMGVGYVPDPFGHIGQLPQILQGFGISSSVFSRGMGDEGETLGSEFRWRSPDGTEVLGIWMPAHYGCFTPVGSFNPWDSDARFAEDAHASLSLDEAVRFTRDLLEHLAARSRTGVVLLDTGSDHLAPRQDLPEIIQGLQAALDEERGAPDAACGERAHRGGPDGCWELPVRGDSDGYGGRTQGTLVGVRLVQGSFEDYVRKVRERIESSEGTSQPSGYGGWEALHVHKGEFRGSRYQNMLYSVLSSRIPLKQLNYEVDAWLTRYAEPLACAAWVFAGRAYPAEMLKLAWRLYLQNQAHDSICGCSTDEVAAEMTARYTQAREIAASVAADSLASLVRYASATRAGDTIKAADAAGAAGEAGTGGMADPRAGAAATGDAAGACCAAALPVMVYNPSPRPVSGIVTAHVPLRVIGRDAEHRESHRDPARASGGQPGRESCEGSCASDTYLVVADGDGGVVRAQTLGVTQPVGATGLGYGFDPSGALGDAVRRGEPSIDIAFPAMDLPAAGCRAYHLLSGPVQRRSDRVEELVGRVVVADRHLENEFLRVQVSERGALDVYDKRTGFVYHGLNVFEDSGDAGDEYDYSPVPDEPLVTGNAAACRVAVEHAGPYIGRLRAEIPWAIPACLDTDRGRRVSETVPMTIVTHVTLAAGASHVEVRTEVENTAVDHRLRALFPAGVKIDTVCARGQFDVVERNVRPGHGHGRGGSGGTEWFQPEAAIAPHQGFVDASDGVRGLAVATRGLPEYECLVERDGGAVIAITLLRCVERISRGDLVTRRGHAGPPVFTPGAQCIGRHVFEYAVVPHAGSWSRADVGSIAQRYLYPCVAYVSRGPAGVVPARPGSQGARLSLIELRDGGRDEGGDGCRAADGGDPEGARALVVSAIKKAEASDDLIVRVHNPSGRGVSARLASDVQLEGARPVRLDETPVEPAPPSLADRNGRCDLGRSGVATRPGAGDPVDRVDPVDPDSYGQGPHQEGQGGFGSSCRPERPSHVRDSYTHCAMCGPHELELCVGPKQVVTLALKAARRSGLRSS